MSRVVAIDADAQTTRHYPVRCFSISSSGLDLGSETLERHHASNHFQRITLRGNRRKPPVRIEESKLPHRPHTRESCCHNSDSHKFAEVAIFRGALSP
jgi:hypothetical protein